MSEKRIRPSGETGAASVTDGDNSILLHPADILHEARLLGFAEGWAARQVEIDRANADADRFYRLAFAPRGKLNLGPSYADLERVRRAIYGGAA